MAKVFRPSTREASILSKIESSKEFARRRSIDATRDCVEPLANSISMKLVENKLVETTNKTSLQDQLQSCIEVLGRAEDFDVDYSIAPIRHLINNANIVSLYITAFVLETVINHKDVIDIFGSDEEIYYCIHKQVSKYIPA
ncbi:MAG: hypothetical protein JRH15_03360 [Deltaproteobacteria bacterium]|nr:hypothetical protein [Deltaproteobacteria bacterium]